VHGEAAVAAAFAEQVHKELGWQVAVPALGMNVDLC
jgi:hypothetical protein